jgi:hypothetical protein
VSTCVKPKIPHVDHQKSEGFKANMKLGQSIANQLEPFMSCDAVAEKLGISKQAVRKIECLALAKIAKRLRESVDYSDETESGGDTVIPFALRCAKLR